MNTTAGGILGMGLFSSTHPAVFQSLPVNVLDADTVLVLKFRLKTHLFSQALCSLDFLLDKGVDLGVMGIEF